MIYIRELAPRDAEAVAHIEAALHPAAIADGADRHREHLHAALAEGVNLSFGAFDDDRLVAYVLCYGFEPGRFSGEHGRVLYLEDTAVLPRYGRTLPKLVRRFARDASRYFSGSLVECHAVGSAFAYWQRHAASLSRLGLTLVGHEPTGETVGGHFRYVMRWRLPAAADPVPDVAALLDRLPAETVTVDGRRYEVKVVRDESDWPALEKPWDDLLLAIPGHTVFQSHRYQRLWWRHFGSDDELFVVLLLREGVLQGIAPLQIRTVEHYGRYCRQLAFIGSRWEVDRPQLIFPREHDVLTRVLVRFLASQAGRWDIADFHEQPAGSAGLALLQHAFREAGYLVGTSRDSDCAYLRLDGTWDAFLASKSSLFRKNLKAAGRRLRGMGEFQYMVYESMPEVLEQLELYRDVERRSWKHEEGVGVARNDDYFEFYRELAAQFGADGRFVVRMITVDGKAVAGTFGLRFDGVFYSLQIAHDREFSRCSPGTYLEALEMEDCFRQGDREYEFLGGFLNNKSRWTSTFRFTTQLQVYRRTPFFVALHTWRFRLKPVCRALSRRVKSLRQPIASASGASHE